MPSNSATKSDDNKKGATAGLSDAPKRTRAGADKRASGRADSIENNRSERDAGDQVNRFLLCTLVSESSKRIKARAEKAGEPLPLAMIVRGVLRAYRVAASDKGGPLAGADLDMPGLQKLNEKVLKSEIDRHTRERVKNSEAKLARAERLGDETRIKAERSGLELAVDLRNRLAEFH
ncbi:MAG: hypothetical protein WAV20_26370 [Blastocatellia bacterium]